MRLKNGLVKPQFQIEQFMKRMICILFILIGNTISYAEISISNDRKEEYKEWVDYVESIKNTASNEEVFKNLSLALIRLRNDSNPDGIITYQAVQEAAIKTPGFVDYFTNHILSTYENRMNVAYLSKEYDKYNKMWYNSIQYDIMTLITLPCESNVYALGELLNYSKIDTRGSSPEFPNDTVQEKALLIINDLPIKNRPYPKIRTNYYGDDDKFPEALVKWRQWFADVKAGKIKVEFGPEVLRNGTMIPPIAERHQTRPPKPMPTKIQSAVTTSAHTESSSWLWVTGSLAILGGYAAWRMRKNEG